MILNIPTSSEPIAAQLQMGQRWYQFLLSLWRNTAFYQDSITLADDTATSLAAIAGGASELVMIVTSVATDPSPRGSFWHRPSTPACANIAMVNVTNITFTTGVLTGTTGADGDFTISSSSADLKLYFENRAGASRTFNVARMKSV